MFETAAMEDSLSTILTSPLFMATPSYHSLGAGLRAAPGLMRRPQDQEPKPRVESLPHGLAGFLRLRASADQVNPKPMTNLRLPPKRNDGRAQWQNPCDKKRSLSLLMIRAIYRHRKV